MHSKVISAISAITALSDLRCSDAPSVEEVERIEKEVAKAGRAFGDLVTAFVNEAGGFQESKHTIGELFEEYVSDEFYLARGRAQDREEDAEYEDPNAEHCLTASQLGVGRYA